ncbi:hypothetical protein OEZ85_006887 [Tetradesmus obliquus]|uniref:Protein FAM136A n=1 Tax=Tetradesmus obliquus TaxID=3088 RepID=A0ABY8TVY5_TETOB|nr:hypothetical protein OEZ85_006887 [Tetradesmus obliquus]
MSQPPTVQKLQSTLEAALDELQRKNLIPLQKDSFLCAAKCCDKHSDMQALQQCTVNCQAKVQTAHQVLYGNLEDFQKRFQRCLLRCEDQAKDALPPKPKEKDMEKAQDQIMECMDLCAVEYTGKVAKLKADVGSSLSQIGK